MLLRRKTKEIFIGNIPLGGDNPIRIQSMTNTQTQNTEATLAQIRRLVDAGCEYVRLAVPTIKDAEHLAVIKNELLRQNCAVPLIADVHFNPKAAEIAAEIVEKVRINPGNYVDRNVGKLHYTDLEYREELERIKERLSGLVEICKQNNTAIRIGTNHGSLSERIMSRYGDTPEGMAQSAYEFVKICEELDFRNIVLSMKASNVKVMVYSTRLLVNKLDAENLNYPVHLGVTEAGDSDDGRIKSAAGIGSLLLQGIGDTIRVSLTEAPEKEIPVAQKIASICQPQFPPTDDFLNCTSYSKNETFQVENIGSQSVPVVISSNFQSEADYYWASSTQIKNKLGESFPVFKNLDEISGASEKLNFFRLKNLSFDVVKELYQIEKPFVLISALGNISDEVKLFKYLKGNGIKIPVILQRNFSDENTAMIQGASEMALFLINGYGNGLDFEQYSQTAFNVLQATGTRISKAEFISCPSCGRTLYDITHTLQQVKKELQHLTGVKIGVMGCIVNGPGEMADADYGYVGSGPGKITLYKGKTVVKKDVREEDALQELIALIKENGDWIEKEEK